MNHTTALHSIFETALLIELEKNSEFMSVPAGGVIIEYGQTVRVMPLVLSGSIKVSRQDDQGKELLLYYINPGESCAMTLTCCMEFFPSEIEAIAEDDVTLLAIPVPVMDEWLQKYPTWKKFIMRSIRFRFHELLKTVDQIAFQNLDDRLIYYLKEKTKALGSSLINLSHQQIAQELATSRVVISRLLKKLELEKRVLLYRNQIKVLHAL
jgi:CRP/FNR family transcriptional regulator